MVVAPWKYDALFKEHQISAGQLSANSSSTETLYCLISVPWLKVALKCEIFSSFYEVLRLLHSGPLGCLEPRIANNE